MILFTISNRIMILNAYFSKLNRTFQNTSTFSDGGLRFGWKPPSLKFKPQSS